MGSYLEVGTYLEKNRRSKYNVILGRVGVTTVAVEKK
jgi:hypothetical protein